MWPAEVDYYTEASTETEIEVLSVQESRVSGGAQLGYGELFVTSQVTQYRRVRRFTHENLGVLPLDYPPTTLDTAGYWLEVTAEAQEALMQAGDWRDSPNDYGPDWQEQRAKRGPETATAVANAARRRLATDSTMCTIEFLSASLATFRALTETTGRPTGSAILSCYADAAIIAWRRSYGRVQAWMGWLMRWAISPPCI